MMHSGRQHYMSQNHHPSGGPYHHQRHGQHSYQSGYQSTQQPHQQPPQHQSQHQMQYYNQNQPQSHHRNDQQQQQQGKYHNNAQGDNEFDENHVGVSHQHGSHPRQSGGGYHGHHNSRGIGLGHGPPHHYHSQMMGMQSGMPARGTVVMVYGLNPDRVNCNRLFNLFCLYGNVARIKFLRSKVGCAMVQMGDVPSVDRCLVSLNKMVLFGNELQIAYSKQAFLHDVVQPYALPDGSPSFNDFIDNKNNRFKTPEVACKNRILPPSQVLHFFNAPLGITEDEIVHFFKETAGFEPTSVKIFTPKDNSKSFSGLATFKDSAEATDALVVCNHLSMPKAGVAHPYILRLCFSPPPSQQS